MTSVICDFDETTGIGRITLNRPEVLNALDVATARAFQAAVRSLTERAGLRVVVIGGAGRSFAAGGDVQSFAAGGPDKTGEVVHATLDALNPAIIALRQHPAPVITAVQGVAAGAGLSLAVSGDLVVAENGARFVVAYDRIGATPDCGLTWFLPRRVGRGLAFRMMMTGATLDAGAALTAGLVDEVAPAGGLGDAVTALATRIAAGPTQSYGHFKRLMDSGASLAQQLEDERAAFADSIHTEDFSEGTSAFLEKRQPRFIGQ
ncbi:enoyl-CoA hydratase/isomerase family protein [Paracoccus panacisoli]|uniref:Enoyl-CoA hydratase/isomerase family protein n=1 Tax=Paracoccus panacisoli TaxID=1510163 RepID=A0ABV6TAJ9_9RHOB